MAKDVDFSGFIRVLDCTDYSRVRLNVPHAVGNQSKDYLSPTEKSAAKLGHEIPFYEELRNQGQIIFQIGKYS